MKDVKVGSVVRVVNCGECYSTFSDFFLENPEADLWNRWERGNKAVDCEEGVVEFIGEHSFLDETIALVGTEDKCFLICVDGLEVISEPKFKVGDKVRVVESGSGFSYSTAESGEVVVTISKVGRYLDRTGYQVEGKGSEKGNQKSNPKYKGFNGEDSFELVAQPRPHAEVIKAWADGAEIEFYNPAFSSWASVECPAWVEEFQYRVKPEKSEAELKIEELEKEVDKIQQEIQKLKEELAQ